MSKFWKKSTTGVKHAQEGRAMAIESRPFFIVSAADGVEMKWHRHVKPGQGFGVPSDVKDKLTRKERAFLDRCRKQIRKHRGFGL